MSGVTLSDNSINLLDSLVVKKPVAKKEPEVIQKKEPEIKPEKDGAHLETNAKEASSTKNVDFVEKKEENFKVGILPDPNTGEPAKFKVDEKGKPIIDANGDLSLDPNGKKPFYKNK